MFNRLVLLFTLATVFYQVIQADTKEPLLSEEELAKVDEAWREDVRKASEPYFAGRGEDSSQVIDFYSKWLRKWLDQRSADDHWQDWRESFDAYSTKTTGEVEEFLQHQYERYHERFENLAEAMEAFKYKAVERLQGMAEKYQKEEPLKKYEPLLTSIEFAKIDEDWREELKSYLQGEQNEDALEMIEFYSKWLGDWFHEQFVDKPRDSWHDWKDSFKAYYQRSKPKVEEFLNKQYERANESVDTVKTKVANMLDLIEAKATDRLEKVLNKLPNVSEHARAEL